MKDNRGFVPIVIVIVIVALLGIGAGGFVLVSKNKTSSPLSPSLQTETPLEPTQTEKQIPSEIRPETQQAASPAFAPLQGIWKVERFYIVQVAPKGDVYLDTGTNTKEIPIRSGEKNPYFEFKGNLLCLGGKTDEQGVPGPCPSYKPFTVDGNTITFRQAPEITPESWKWTIKEGKLEIILEFPGSLPEYGVQRHIYTSVRLDQAQQPAQQTATPQPDYYISVDSTPAQTGAAVGESATFLAGVRNQGAASKQSSAARLRIDVGEDGSWDVTLQSESLGSLATNKSARVTWTWKPTTKGNHGWELCADTPSSIVESNEVNNCASGSFTVR